MLNNTDVLSVCADMLARAGIPVDALAAHIESEATKRPRNFERVCEVLAMSERPDGVTTLDLAAAYEVSGARAAQIIDSIAGPNSLVRCKLPGFPLAHWFRTEELAQAFRARMAPPVPKPVPKPAVKRVKAGKPGHLLAAKGGTASPPAPAPAVAVEVVVPANVRRTFVPAPLGRFEVPADAPLTGGFSATRPGMNPLTGKAWGA